MNTEPLVEEVVRGGRSLQRREVDLIVAAAVLLVAALIALQDVPRGGRSDQVTLPQQTAPSDAGRAAEAPGPAEMPDQPDPTTSFEGGTGMTLVVAGAAGLAVTLDLDTGIHDVFELPGFSPQQPFDLWTVEDTLVAGARRVYAVASTDSHRQIAEPHHFLADVDPGRLWLVDYPDLDGHELVRTLSRGEPIVTSVARIALDGSLISPWFVLEPGLTPLRGVPGGLALRDDDERLFRYDPERAVVVPYLSDEPASLIDAHDDHVIWCDRTSDRPRLSHLDPEATECESLMIENGAGDAVTRIELGPDELYLTTAWLSPDARHLAVIAQAGGRVRRPPEPTGRTEYQDPRLELRIRDVTTLRLVDRMPIDTSNMVPPHGGWTSDGQFFTLTHRRSDGATAIIRWTSDHGMEHADMSWITGSMPWGSGQFVVLSADQAPGVADRAASDP